MAVRFVVRSMSGGCGAVLGELHRLDREVRRGSQAPDVVMVAVDANCKGFVERRHEIDARAGSPADRIVLAIPDPHIERWMLVVGQAFKKVVGRGCSAPDSKCAKGRHKNLLSQAVVDAGVRPLLGGIEYARELALAIDLGRAEIDASLARFLSEWRARLKRLGAGREVSGRGSH